MTEQTDLDNQFMLEALKEAQKAYDLDEAPVGAVVVYNGQIYARGHNLRENRQDPTAHAEIVAIREASQKRNCWRLHGMTLYVTLEPCPMCAGAMVNARLDRVVFGAADPKAGAVGSLLNIVADERLNHRLEFRGGVLADESQTLLKSFFKSKRHAGGARLL